MTRSSYLNLQMKMESGTKALLTRLKSLEDGEGLKKAYSFCRILQAGVIVLGLLIFVSLYFGLPVLIIIFGALSAGWLIAERNALETRLKQWPEMKQYIDWEKVNRDLQIE